jgi:hypothetical protein
MLYWVLVCIHYLYTLVVGCGADKGQGGDYRVKLSNYIGVVHTLRVGVHMCEPWRADPVASACTDRTRRCRCPPHAHYAKGGYQGGRTFPNPHVGVEIGRWKNRQIAKL